MTGMLLDAGSAVLLSGLAYGVFHAHKHTHDDTTELVTGALALVLLIVAAFAGSCADALRHGLACSHTPAAPPVSTTTP